MKPPAFDYYAPSSLEEALSLKAQLGEDAKFLAGGQSLVPAMNFRLVRPAALIDLNGLTDLDHLESEADGTLRIGALTRYARLERDPRVRSSQPMLAEALPHVAHPQIRTRGTLCGNMAHADPASELPAVMLAQQALFTLCSGTTRRVVPAEGFFQGLFTTALRAEELLLEIRLPPAAARTGSAFEEAARRRGDYAMMAVAASVTLAEDGRCQRARIALCNAGPAAWLAERAAGLLVGTRGIEAVADAAEAVQRDIDPPGSVQASPAFQRHLAGVLTRRALVTAFGRAGGSTGRTGAAS